MFVVVASKVLSENKCVILTCSANVGFTSGTVYKCTDMNDV